MKYAEPDETRERLGIARTPGWTAPVAEVTYGRAHGAVAVREHAGRIVELEVSGGRVLIANLRCVRVYVEGRVYCETIAELEAAATGFRWGDATFRAESNRCTRVTADAGAWLADAERELASKEAA